MIPACEAQSDFLASVGEEARLACEISRRILGLGMARQVGDDRQSCSPCYWQLV